MRGRDATFLTHTRKHTRTNIHTLTRMLFSYNPKSPGEHLAEPPPQCGARAGIPQASRGAGSVLILLFTVVRARQKRQCAVPAAFLYTSRFLQCNLKREQGSCRRQAPVGLSMEMFKRREEGGGGSRAIPPSYSPDNTGSSKFIIPLWLFWELKKLGKLHTEVSPDLPLRVCFCLSPSPSHHLYLPVGWCRC